MLYAEKNEFLTVAHTAAWSNVDKLFTRGMISRHVEEIVLVEEVVLEELSSIPSGAASLNSALAVFLYKDPLHGQWSFSNLIISWHSISASHLTLKLDEVGKQKL